MNFIDNLLTKVGDIVYLRGHTTVPMVVCKITPHYRTTYADDPGDPYAKPIPINTEIGATYQVTWLDKENRPCTASYLRDCLYAEYSS